MVRLKTKHGRRTLVPGLIVACLQKDKPPTFEILVNGVEHSLTHRDIGPFMLLKKKED